MLRLPRRLRLRLDNGIVVVGVVNVLLAVIGVAEETRHGVPEVRREGGLSSLRGGQPLDPLLQIVIVRLRKSWHDVGQHEGPNGVPLGVRGLRLQPVVIVLLVTEPAVEPTEEVGPGWRVGLRLRLRRLRLFLALVVRKGTLGGALPLPPLREAAAALVAFGGGRHWLSPLHAVELHVVVAVRRALRSAGPASQATLGHHAVEAAAHGRSCAAHHADLVRRLQALALLLGLGAHLLHGYREQHGLGDRVEDHHERPRDDHGDRCGDTTPHSRIRHILLARHVVVVRMDEGELPHEDGEDEPVRQEADAAQGQHLEEQCHPVERVMSLDLVLAHYPRTA
mmetsp:Transcript_97393/g.252001  ORF Transcript_97393/g.252001 Transcript_97393/m.252001 type:complete len:338 (+) Transcript_97393:1019-2032(+)